jgi:hypothetical protein
VKAIQHSLGVQTVFALISLSWDLWAEKGCPSGKRNGSEVGLTGHNSPFSTPFAVNSIRSHLSYNLSRRNAAISFISKSALPVAAAVFEAARKIMDG